MTREPGDIAEATAAASRVAIPPASQAPSNVERDDGEDAVAELARRVDQLGAEHRALEDTVRALEQRLRNLQRRLDAATPPAASSSSTPSDT